MRVAGHNGSAIGMSGVLRLLVGAGLAASFFCAHAQVITTVAGTNFTFPNTPLAAINAPLGSVSGVAADAAGNVYIADSDNDLVLRLMQDGTVIVVAGNGIRGFSGDGGPATNATLDFPYGVAVDSAGDLYIADWGNNRIRKVSGGIITTVAGNGAFGFSGDGGPATNATLDFPRGVAVDSVGNLYVADTLNNVIRKVSGGIITTVAGTGAFGFSGDGGPATSAALGFPDGIAVDAAGNLYIPDSSRIRKVSGGIITTVAGTGAFGFSGDGGPATSAALSFPRGVAVDSVGNLYIADTLSNVIRKVSGGIISTVAGNGASGFSGDGGLATSATLDNPQGVAVDSIGNVHIADTTNDRIRKVARGIITTVAGNGRFNFSGDGGPAASATLRSPQGVAVDSADNLYTADSDNNRIRKVSGGIITTVAGSGSSGFSGDGGPATSASLLGPAAIAVDSAGDLYIADQYNNRIRKVSGGIITTVAGNGALDFSGDGGPATSATLVLPVGVAVDAANNLYIADTGNNRIRKVSGGIITTVAGNGAFGFSGDGGPATNATLYFPDGIAFDAADNLYIADSINNRIRKVSGGIITTVAGNGTGGNPGGFSGDGGPATSAALSRPYSIAVDAAGNLYIADSHNNRIRKVSGGIITTLAGNGLAGFSGDGGPATSASFHGPEGVAVDSVGNIYIADTTNDRIREVLALKPPVTVTPLTLSFSGNSQGAPAMAQTLSLISSVDGLAFSATVPDGVTWLQLNPSNGFSPRLIQVTADPTNLAQSSIPYQTTITINTPNANPGSFSVPVSFTVGPGQPPTLSIDKTNLSFPFARQGSARSQTILVSNSGGGTLKFVVAATTVIGNWLSVLPTTGQALPASPATLTVTANPTGLSAGTYTGQVTVVAGVQTQTIPVTMTISTDAQAVLLSQTGLSFLGVSQGGVLPPQSFGVLNIGTGVMNWKASTSTLPAGGTWLNVTPASGSTDASADAVPTVQMNVDAASLPQGTYYGVVRVDAPGAANTPQVVTVVVQVLPPGSPTGAVIQPPELLFTATAGGESPGSQNLFVYNVAAAPKSFQASGDKVLNLAILPTDATLDPQQPTQVVVQPFTSGLAAGVYTGVITLQFSDGNVLSANVRVIVAAMGANSGSSTFEQGHAARKFDSNAACTPTKLVLASNTLAQSYAVPAGYPVGLEVNVKDDCGTALTSGSVTASFSNSDPALQLQSLKNGLWNATWQTNNGSESAVTITLQAVDVQGKLQGKSVVNTSLTATTDQPVFPLQGVVSAAGLQRFVPLAPGSIISIYGTNLAGTPMQATSTPLPIQLVDTTVAIGGRALPLFYVSDAQVNAQVPFEIDPNATYQLLVTRGNTISLPVGVDVAPAQPAVFTDTSVAPNQGVIFVVRSGKQFEATPATPASPGDVIVMFCAGLGAVNPTIASGVPANGQPTTVTPTVTIGGLNTTVNFSGLAPGFVSLYQINAVVPEGVPPGNAVPVTINIAGQTSPPVVMAIQ